MRKAVIIPCAGEAVAAEAARAVLAQDEVTPVVLAGVPPRKLAAHPRLRVVDAGTVLPPGLARNIGAKHAPEADMLVFLDADCVPLPGWLETLEKRLAAGESLAGGAMRPIGVGYFFLADQVTCFFDQLDGNAGGVVDTITASNLAVTRALWEKTGGFPEDLLAGEDLEFVLRCRREGARPYLETGAVVHHKPGPIGPRRMLGHAAHWGRHSRAVRARYTDVLPFPFVLRFRPLLALLAPVIGAAFAAHQLRRTPRPYRRYALWPAMALAKTAWCVAAAVLSPKGEASRRTS
ncbi:MAG: glycosyltransferase [Deltaproteobacteria bacterium]|nr:glycosyltransferase [Deltaproteobacteria bacterium]